MKEVSLTPGLYLVATPIGNLRDISLRALDVLAGADAVICEDTRVTGKLLQAHGIKKQMISYNDHNAGGRRGRLLEKLAEGGRLALVSDAGTPLVSDPGYKLVRDCLDLGLNVTSVPGASAALSALQLSGLPPDRFCFLGFLPPKQAARKQALKSWQTVPATLVLYETGPRLLAALEDIGDVLGARAVAVVRELTKMYEEARRGSVSELVHLYRQEGTPKGEIVLVIGPPEEDAGDDVEARLREALETMSVRDAAAFVAESSGRPKKEVYDLALRLSKGEA